MRFPFLRVRRPRLSRRRAAPLSGVLITMGLLSAGGYAQATIIHRFTVDDAAGKWNDYITIHFRVLDYDTATGALAPAKQLPCYVQLQTPFFSTDPNNAYYGFKAVTTNDNGDVYWQRRIDTQVTQGATAIVVKSGDPGHDSVTRAGTFTLAISGAAFADSAALDQRFTFQTPDYLGGTTLQSLWSAEGQAGFSLPYDLTTSWKTSATFDNYVNPHIPSLDVGLFTIPGFDLGEFGGGGNVFTKGKDVGLRFALTATGGHVSINYPLQLHYKLPKYSNPGQIVNVHVSFTADRNAVVQTNSPEASATVSLKADAQFYLDMDAKLFGKSVTGGRTELIDLVDRTDPESPKYDPKATGESSSQAHRRLHIDKQLFNTTELLNNVLGDVGEYSYPPKPTPPEVTANAHLPVITTVGTPGAASHYTNVLNGGGSTGTSATKTFFEYTSFITVPDEVTQNPYATYARGYDDLVTLKGDFTNILTDSLNESGIPVPWLNYDFTVGPIAAKANFLDLYAKLGLGFLQEFAFVPKPKIALAAPGQTPGQYSYYDIDPVNGVDVPVRMPNRDPAHPNDPVQLTLTPRLRFDNKFISNTYLALTGGVFFDPAKLKIGPQNNSGTQRFGVLNFAPYPTIGVGVTVPVPIYPTSFPIAFADQTGAAFTLTSYELPLARLVSAYPPFNLIDETEPLAGYLATDSLTLFADTSPVKDPSGGPDIIAPPLFGRPAGSNTTYNTRFFLDGLTIPIQAYREASDLTPAYFVGAGFLGGTKAYPSNAEIHTIYAQSTALSNGANFGPKTTSISYPVGYAPPLLDKLSYKVPNNAPLASDSRISAAPFTSAPSTNPNDHIVGPIPAGSPGFTLLAEGFRKYRLDRDFSVGGPIDIPTIGSYSAIKVDGLKIPPDTALPVNFGKSWVSGLVPSSMLATAGVLKITVGNPDIGGGGGDSNTYYLLVVNPAPHITSVSVSSASENSGGNSQRYQELKTLTAGTASDSILDIQGANFVPTVVVKWNDQLLETTFVSRNHLYAKVPANLYTFQQSVLIKVINPSTTVNGVNNQDGGEDISTDIKVNPPTPQIRRVENASDIAGTSGGIFYVGQGATIITVRGSGFAYRSGNNFPSFAYWNDSQALEAQFVDGQTLRVPLSADLFVQAGQFPLTIGNTVQLGPGSFLLRKSSRYALSVVYPHPMIAPASATTPTPINPPAIGVGDKNATITVTGGVFYPNSVVKINKIACVTKFVDAMHLMATVPDTLVNTPGTYSLIVSNPVSTTYDTPDSSGAQTDGGDSKPASFRVDKLALPQIRVMASNVIQSKKAGIEADLMFTNIGSAVAQDVQTTAITLDNAPGSPGIVNLGKLDGGKSVTLHVVFLKASGASGSVSTLRVTGSTSRGSFTTTLPVTLP